MTINELIKELKRFPPDSHVVIGEGKRFYPCRIRYEEIEARWYGSSERRKVTAIAFKRFQEKGVFYNDDGE